MEAGTRAVAYCRVSTSEQGQTGLGLDAQDAAIRSHCEQRRWVLAALHREVASGAKRKRRPILEDALKDLAKGDVLIVSRADRLARSLGAYVALIDQARAEGWAIVAADGSIDLTTPHGRAMAGMSAVFAELEAELIGDRTSKALAAARDKGIQLGRKPASVPAPTIGSIQRWRAEGQTLQAVADRLNDSGAPSPTGKRWHPQSVARVSQRQSG